MKTSPFIGRNKELQTLYKEWRELKQKQSFIVVQGNPGVGKTTLVKKFYDELRYNNDPGNYWPEIKGSESKFVNLVPNFEGVIESTKGNAPWLWLSFKCINDAPNHQNEIRLVSFESVRTQIRFHLFQLLQSAQSKKQNIKLAKSIFSLMASFVIPGSGALIEQINNALDSGGDLLSIEGFVDTLKERGSFNKPQNGSVDEILNKETKKIEVEASQAFRALLKLNSVPIVLVVDDAQFIDQSSLNVIKELIKNAKRESWPLMVIVTVWPESLNNTKSDNYSPALVHFLRDMEEAKISLTFPLSALNEKHCSELIIDQLPQIGYQAASFLAKRSGGNLDMLFDYVGELKHSIGWLSDDGTLLVAVEDLEWLPSKTLDFAKRKIEQSGKNIKELLILGSGQGWQFDECTLKSTLDYLKMVIDTSNELKEADVNYGFISLKNAVIDSQVAEFSRPEYFEVSREFYHVHPHSKFFLQAISYSLYNSISSNNWYQYSPFLKQTIVLRLYDLSVQLKQMGKYWDNIVAAKIKELVAQRVLEGDYINATKFCELALKVPELNPAVNTEIWKLMVACAYIAGDIDLEKKYLEMWPINTNIDALDNAFLKSRFFMRQGECKKGLAILDEFDMSDLPPAHGAELNLNKAVMLWAGGLSSKALDIIVTVEKLISAPETPNWLQASFHHSASLVLHDLEKNEQVLFYSKQSLELERKKGDIHQALICQVNLGDAYWGLGMLDKAFSTLKSAYEEALDSSLEHTIDIATICYANVLAEIGEKPKCLKLYDEGISIAKRIGHKWDWIYGTIYQQRLVGEDAPEQALIELEAMANFAREYEYYYLADLAMAFQYVICFRGSLSLRFHQEVDDAWDYSPLLRCHQSCYNVLLNKDNRKSVKEFLANLAACEGIKGDRNFIMNGITVVIESGMLNDIEIEFVNRWQSRYCSLNDNSQYKKCDFTKCEARCCYDGVYLNTDEEENIRSLVKQYPEYFVHLPPDFIVDSNWYNISGRKTAVRPHRYVSPDFPVHFNQTRCVFADDQGACSLHSLALKEGLSIADTKPASCILFPLRVKNGKAKQPTLMGERDEAAIGIDYPGYSNFVPCSQSRVDGKKWFDTFKEEIIFLSNRNS